MKSLRPVDSSDALVSDSSEDDDPGNPTVHFRGERRTNATHRSLTDPEARLYRKSYGAEAKLYHSAHVLMENRHGLVVDVSVSEANTRSEREAALEMIRRSRRRHSLAPKTLGADTAYDAGEFLLTLEVVDEVVPLVPSRKGKIRTHTVAGRACCVRADASGPSASASPSARGNERRSITEYLLRDSRLYATMGTATRFSATC